MLSPSAGLGVLARLALAVQSLWSGPEPEPALESLCLVGQPCFPSASDLAAFNKSIDGQLFSERPIGAVCYAKDPAYNKKQCAAEVPKFFDGWWISDHFPAYEQSNWATCGRADSCYIPNPNNGTASCGQGSVPTYAVHATKEEHVTAYMKFAVKHNLRVVVKNTGHDFIGRSSGQGGFALWTHLLKSKSRNRRFVPKGCKWRPQDSVTLGVGVQWAEAYGFADEQNVTLVGGDNPHVGSAGGWVLGGGHGFLSPALGLGVDNLYEVDIVTPDGNLQTINECSNPDLFWAIRGGGGTTFGITTSITYRAHPAMQFGLTYGVVNDRALGLNDTRRIVSSLAAIAPSLGDLGIGGGLATSTGSPGGYIILVHPRGNKDSIQAATAPFWAGVTDVITPKGFITAPNFRAWFDVLLELSASSPSGFPAGLSSRLFPREFFAPNRVAKTVDAIQAGQKIMIDAGTDASIQLLLAPPSKRGTNNSRKTSVTPVFYESLWHILYIGRWQYSQAIHDAVGPLRTLMPDSGVYSSESDTYEPDYRKAFWGTKNYARLESIKKKVDPKNILQVWHGVGTDENSPLWKCYKAP